MKKESGAGRLKTSTKLEGGPLLDQAAGRDASAGHTEVKTTTCYMCACRCGIRVHLKDGEVRYIEGNPDHPLNKGSSAPRALRGS